MATIFDIQGHRGARGLKPENTLPSFEAAFDAGVTSVETDIHITRDGIPVLAHEPLLISSHYRPLSEVMPDSFAEKRPLVTMSLAMLRQYRVDKNPDPVRFAQQNPEVTPLTSWFASERGMDPYAVPTLADLFEFASAYAGRPGADCGKSALARQRAAELWFDLELKRVPFHPELTGDGPGTNPPGRLEKAVLAQIHASNLVSRVRVRSFDHRSVLAIRQMEPNLAAGVLVAYTAPVSPQDVAAAAGASYYFPAFEFLDETQVRQAHDGGIKIIPWTVNDPADWGRLVDWGVDGITTDYPDHLATWYFKRAR